MSLNDFEKKIKFSADFPCPRFRYGRLLSNYKIYTKTQNNKLFCFGVKKIQFFDIDLDRNGSSQSNKFLLFLNPDPLFFIFAITNIKRNSPIKISCFVCLLDIKYRYITIALC